MEVRRDFLLATSAAFAATTLGLRGRAAAQPAPLQASREKITEARRIAAQAAAYDIPVIPDSGDQRDAMHFIMATRNSPWAEMVFPPGGRDEVYHRYLEDNVLTRVPKASIHGLARSLASAGISKCPPPDPAMQRKTK